MAEANLRRALTISRGNPGILVSRPIPVVLMCLAVASLIIGVYNQRRINRLLEESGEKAGEP